MWKLTSFQKHNKSWEVSLDTSYIISKCSCHRFESCGIPYCHIICIMKEQHFEEVPKSLILDRWTKHAKRIGLLFDIGKEKLNTK